MGLGWRRIRWDFALKSDKKGSNPKGPYGETMKALNSSILSLLAILPLAAAAAGPTPPTQLDKDSHNEWLNQIGAQSTSPYADYTFGWFNTQKTRALPEQVNKDPDKIFVVVDKPLAEAVKVETAGDVESGTSYGLETYAVIDAPVQTVMETILFRWGKPVGQSGGITFPYDTVFGYREERAQVEWGPGAYKTFTFKRNGGIAQDMNDVFAMVVRGNNTDGYTLVGSFLEPYGNGTTTTSTTYITIISLRPLAGGKTDYRVAGMLTGQSYAFFGVENGRKNFGFNQAKIREGQKEFIKQVKALKDTGKIPERRP